MSGSIENRLTKLEGAAGAGACPACGAGGAIDTGDLTFTLNTAGEPSRDPEPCGRCGRLPLQFTIRISGKEIQ
jgi:hypothetical protein